MRKNDKSEINALLPFTENIPKRIIENHLRFLDKKYFQIFTLQEFGSHLKNLSRSNREEPVIVSILPCFHERSEIIIFTYDSPSLFSLITGILSQAFLNIVQGHVFTYSPSIIPLTASPADNDDASELEPAPPVDMSLIILSERSRLMRISMHGRSN